VGILGLLARALGLPGPQRMGISLELGSIHPTFIFKYKNKFDVMKVFTFFHFRGERICWVLNFYFPMKISWGEACKDLHGSKFPFYASK